MSSSSATSVAGLDVTVVMGLNVIVAKDDLFDGIAGATPAKKAIAQHVQEHVLRLRCNAARRCNACTRQSTAICGAIIQI